MAQATPCHRLTPEAVTLLPLHPTEERLLRYMRALGHGLLEIRVVAGYPVLIEHVMKQVKLT